MMRSRKKSNVARASTHCAPSPSWMSAACTRQTMTSPMASTNRCRLRPFTFFSRVEPAAARLIRRLYALTVEHGDARFGVLTGLLTNLLPQPSIHPFQRAVFPPILEEFVNCSPGRKIVRQHPPGTAGPGEIKQRVDNFPHVSFAGPPTRFFLRNQRFDPLPLRIGQIGRVSLPCIHEWTLTDFKNDWKTSFQTRS